MIISVITVCYQAREALESTMESVLSQTYPDIEYVIVDGGSTDGTLALLQGRKAENTIWISESDQGIYDAMNKGVRLCHGDYTIFMNAGDKFASESAVEQIAEEIFRCKSDILYGNYKECCLNQEIPVIYTGKEISALFFLTSRMICHQAMISSVEWLRKHPFCLDYRYCADREWLIWCYKNKAKVRHIPVMVAEYDRNGVSSDEKAIEKIREEIDHCLKIYYPIQESLLEVLKRNKRIRNWIRQKAFHGGK